MTTDNRTNELTPEQILVDEWIRQADRSKSMTGMDAIWFPDAEETLAVLRANGLLSEGAPSEAQVEAAAKTMHETRNPWFAAYGDWGAAGFEIKQAFRESARAALVAAQGAAPQPACLNCNEPVAESDLKANYVGRGYVHQVKCPQEPNQNETKSGNNFVSLDPEKVAGVINAALAAWEGEERSEVFVARALCEAYTEGKLT